MNHTTLTVVLDANVLFPFTLRDTLLRSAANGYFQLYWSDKILDEATRNLVRTGTVTQQQANRLRSAMTTAFPEAMVDGFDSLIGTMPNAKEDRHVAAAAVKAGAHLIVTQNLRDFRRLPTGIAAQSPDNFLLHLLEYDTTELVTLLQNQAAALKNPPIAFEELLSGLSKTVPRFVDAIRAI